MKLKKLNRKSTFPLNIFSSRHRMITSEHLFDKEKHGVRASILICYIFKLVYLKSDQKYNILCVSLKILGNFLIRPDNKLVKYFESLSNYFYNELKGVEIKKKLPKKSPSG